MKRHYLKHFCCFYFELHFNIFNSLISRQPNVLLFSTWDQNQQYKYFNFLASTFAVKVDIMHSNMGAGKTCEGQGK